MLSRSEVEAALCGLRAYIHPDEIPVLYHFAGHVPDAGRILEIGTGNGASALMWLDATKTRGVRVYTVDNFAGCSTGKFNPDKERTYKAIQDGIENLKFDPFDIIPRFCMLNGYSAAMARLWKKQPDQVIHLLYIDGDHTYDGCHLDFYSWSGYVPVGGHVLIHDSCRPDHSLVKPNDFDQGYPGPTQVKQEIAMLDEWELVEEVFSMSVLKKVDNHG